MKSKGEKRKSKGEKNNLITEVAIQILTTQQQIAMAVQPTSSTQDFLHKK